MIFGIAYTQLVELVSTFKTVCVQVEVEVKFEAKFESNQLLSPNFTDVCMVGGKFVHPTIQTSVKFRDLRELFLRSL